MGATDSALHTASHRDPGKPFHSHFSRHWAWDCSRCPLSLPPPEDFQLWDLPAHVSTGPVRQPTPCCAGLFGASVGPASAYPGAYMA